MKKVLVSRYGAYGDVVHMSHLPRLLKEQGYDIVDLELNFKGVQLMQYNPFVDNIIYFEPVANKELYSNAHTLNKHWAMVSAGYDKFINLFQSLEVDIIAAENSNEYFMHKKNRERYAKINYYDQTTIKAGYTELVGKYWGELYFTEEEHKIAQEYMQKKGTPIIINLNGTTLNKRMLFAPELVQRLLDKYPETRLIITGDKFSSGLELPKSDMITSVVGVMPFRQVALMAKYARMAITMESGFGCVANMWQIPTVQMMTCASIINHGNGCKNDFSLQSPARCSPCNKAQYRFVGCPKKDGHPLCCYFDLDVVMNRIEEAYAAMR